jgi:hypothetical protein
MTTTITAIRAAMQEHIDEYVGTLDSFAQEAHGGWRKYPLVPGGHAMHRLVDVADRARAAGRILTIIDETGDYSDEMVHTVLSDKLTENEAEPDKYTYSSSYLAVLDSAVTLLHKAVLTEVR